MTATAQEGAAIGSGHWRKDNGGNANKIVICDHATVVAKNTSFGAAIGIAGSAGASADVTIGTEGATAEKEDVHVAATSKYGSAIGNGRASTKVTIQGHATIRTASSENDVAIGSEYGDVEVTIKDNVAIDTEDTVFGSTYHSSSAIGGGKMSNMVIGVLIIGVLNYGMNFLNINQYWKYVVLGIALLPAVTLDTLQTQAAINRAKKVSGQPPKAETTA